MFFSRHTIVTFDLDNVYYANVELGPIFVFCLRGIATKHTGEHHEQARINFLIFKTITFPRSAGLERCRCSADNRPPSRHASAGELVVHIRHEFKSDDAPFFKPGSEGAQLHTKVTNRADEPVVLKHFINSFRETELKQILDNKDINVLTVVGNMSHMCVDGITSRCG